RTASRPGRRNGVEKTRRMFIKKSNSFIRRVLIDEKNKMEPVTVSDLTIILEKLVEWEIRQNKPVDSDPLTLGAEFFEAELQNRIEVPHQDEGNCDLGSNLAQLFKEHLQIHTVFNRNLRALLNNRPIGQRIGEGHSDLN